jgi:hypothetical protein
MTQMLLDVTHKLEPRPWMDGALFAGAYIKQKPRGSVDGLEAAGAVFCMIAGERYLIADAKLRWFGIRLAVWW